MSMPVISPLDFTSESMVDEAMEGDSPMKQFYCGKTVFLTGGTGFLGILFVEKLLRCNAKAVYALVRQKKNKSPAERIQETFDGAVFVKLKKIDPDYMSRIKLIDGDTSKVDLGLSDDDRKDLIANIEIVIHAAAELRFDKPLQELCFTNVRGTKALTMLAEEMNNLIVFAYISTAYSQFHQERIEEKFYAPPCDPDDMIRVAEHFEKHQTEELSFLTDNLLLPWRNTYVFTKALSEELVRRVAHKFPTIVVRPSMIISTYDDPIPGWSNNLFGVNGIMIGVGLGFIKLTATNEKAQTTEVVCGDFVTNGTLAAIWDKSQNKLTSQTENPLKFDESSSIVHITSHDKCSFDTLRKLMLYWFAQHPSNRSISFPSHTLAEPGLLYFLMTIMYHVIPAIVLDTIFKLTNNKNRLLPSYRKSEDFLTRIAYFCTRPWLFDQNNLKRIIENMSEEDQRFFPCDVFKFKLTEYSFTYFLGLRTYLAKEPLDTVSAGKRRFKILLCISYVTSTIYYGFLVCVLYLLMNVTGVTHYINILYSQLCLLLTFP